jgi:F0F1-type ATP synthase membrane subunit c/vacuolar-type H+-ATPase subunit K
VPVLQQLVPASPPVVLVTFSVRSFKARLRNPAAADGQQGRLFIGFAAAELLGLLAFVVAMILIFVA